MRQLKLHTFAVWFRDLIGPSQLFSKKTGINIFFLLFLISLCDEVEWDFLRGESYF